MKRYPVAAWAKNKAQGRTMDFELTPEQEAIREAIAKICARFGDDYWLAKDKHGGFPEDFYQAIAAGGWLGICIPEEYGGAGLGLSLIHI